MRHAKGAVGNVSLGSATVLLSEPPLCGCLCVKRTSSCFPDDTTLVQSLCRYGFYLDPRGNLGSEGLSTARRLSSGLSPTQRAVGRLSRHRWD